MENFSEQNRSDLTCDAGKKAEGHFTEYNVLDPTATEGTSGLQLGYTLPPLRG
jgi:hypothetical protein